MLVDHRVIEGSLNPQLEGVVLVCCGHLNACKSSKQMHLEVLKLDLVHGNCWLNVSSDSAGNTENEDTPKCWKVT